MGTISFHRMRVLGAEIGVTKVTLDEEAGFVDFEVDADMEVNEMLLDNLDDLHRKVRCLKPVLKVHDCSSESQYEEPPTRVRDASACTWGR